MMHSKYSKVLCLVGIALATLATKASANSQEALFHLQQILENRVRPIVQAVDPNAIVLVRLKTTDNPETPLPGTPFTVRDLAESHPDADLPIEKVEITVLSAKTRFSRTITALIQDTAGDLAPVDVRIHRLPPELRAKALLPLPPAPPAPTNTAPETNRPVAVAPKPQSWLRDRRAMPMALMFFTLVAGVGLMGLIGAFRQGTQRLSAVVEGGMNTLAHRLDAQTERFGAALGARAGNDEDDGSDATRVISGLPETGVLSLLADCYWSGFDSYAAYVWRRVPVRKRSDLLAQLDFLPDYITYLGGVKPQGFGAEQEPCYLSPLPVWHLDNAALTKLVKDHPALRLKLSSIRIAGLKLSTKERMETLRAGLTAPKLLPDFAKLPASPRRPLSPRLAVNLNDEAAERELVAMNDLSWDFMEGIETLAWLARMPDRAVATELERYEAADLASAWVGPAEILEKLGRHLPKKKYDQVKALVAQRRPSRSSATFRALHRASVDWMRSAQAATERMPRPEAKADAKTTTKAEPKAA